MRFFEHKHYWFPMTELNKVVDTNGKVTAALILEKCRCGAIRTIEYGSGVASIIRYSEEKR